MMYNEPKQTKHKKIKKGTLAKLEFKSSNLTFGTIGLKATEAGIISIRQLKSSKQAITKKIKKKGKIWTQILPNIPITAKSIGIRMGKGKGQVSHWGARVSGGTVLFEYCGPNLKLAILALKAGGAKLPLKTKIFN